MAIVFEDGELILAWMATKETVTEWASKLQPFIFNTKMPLQNNFIISSHENIITSTLYRVLKRNK